MNLNSITLRGSNVFVRPVLKCTRPRIKKKKKEWRQNSPHGGVRSLGSNYAVRNMHTILLNIEILESRVLLWSYSMEHAKP